MRIKKTKEYEDLFIPLRYSVDTWMEAGCPKIRLQVGKYWAYLIMHPQSKKPYLGFFCAMDRTRPKSTLLHAGVTGPRAIEFAEETGLLLPS